MPDAPRVTVTVHGPDPLSRAGVVRHLRQEPTVELIDRPRPFSDEPRGTVAVMLAERLDARAGAELRRLVRGGEQRVVLITGELRETELMTVVEYGVRAVLWQHRATPRRLLRAVHRAARAERTDPCGVDRRLTEHFVY
ncbi:DNA-binding response regulator [Streptomyces sp. ME19-01-6]|uniref:DNA-binding response regulator n=1 Tax=Streptomyces sp. ME19-01-6 TaxID=3028686 RepID=UPI0029B555FD|nr:DNA-binding response regulator [Streptomyces sp. ME19-01-6]MDX3226868.1 DNA-binding response regulator [Streptomyces sp. ME19-01-6]